mmetsp:Transcript_34794/g.88138  ORF Transcript_34794/g.88138 Transcript_34794/m.88138 type:complete len:329 (+) Transcript_34794:387-1373(+)
MAAAALAAAGLAAAASRCGGGLLRASAAAATLGHWHRVVGGRRGGPGGAGRGHALRAKVARRVVAGAVAHERGARLQAQVLKHDHVLVAVVVLGGEQLVAVKDRVGARQERERLVALRQVEAARAQAHHRLGHDHARGGDAAHQVQPAGRLLALQGGALDGHQAVDGHRLWVRGQCGQLVDETHAVLRPLAQPDDAARAHADARLAHRLQRVEPVLVLAAGGHLAVELGRGVQVVVVRGEPRVAQLARLLGRQHAQRGAHLHAQPADAAHHLQHALPLARANLRGAAPRGAHAEARAARLARAQRGLVHLLQVHQLLRLHARVLGPGR